MAWNKIGSGQIKDGVILKQHIAPKNVEGTHIADGAITDVHLNIDWAAKGSAILASKKVIDYVQAPARTADVNEGNVNISAGITLVEAATDDDLGVVVTMPNNKVILSEKNDPSKLLTDPSTGHVIFGRITTGFNLAYFTLVNGVETAYTFTESTEYNLQFPARFTLDTVSEMFAANEKFVDGVADVATRLDVAQVVADIFGAGYTLNQDGQPTLSSGQTVVEVIEAVEAVANQNASDIDALAIVLSGTTENPSTGIVAKVSVLETKVSELEGQNLDVRLKAIEDETLATRVETLEGANAESRLTDLEANVDVLKDQTYAKDRRVDKLVDVETSSYTLTVDFGVLTEELPLVGTVDVYINGMLQMTGQHFTEQHVDGIVRGIEFTPNVVKVGDVVQLRWER